MNIVWFVLIGLASVGLLYGFFRILRTVFRWFFGVWFLGSDEREWKVSVKRGLNSDQVREGGHVTGG